jgi:putative endonuclease
MGQIKKRYRIFHLDAFNASIPRKGQMKKYQFYVYIMTNDNNRVLYIGITNNIRQRVIEHREGVHKGFTYLYNVTKLVYVERFKYVNNAILREKQLKEWRRAWKNELVNASNPDWHDLFPTL